ncbi:MAG: hypothetical protein KAJ90_00455 [Desulfobacterales bacterium]|nr:hypothetical protein [Desulfobacterales bacterium]
MKWQEKLTKAERKHLREINATTLSDIQKAVDFQDHMAFPCWECVGIGRKLGMSVSLTAFHKLNHNH